MKTSKFSNLCGSIILSINYWIGATKMNEIPKKLNIGCGHKPLPGWINIDRDPPDDAPDIMRVDVGQGLPFEDNSFNEIFLDNVIEHIYDIPGLMAEIHRVLAVGGVCNIVTPHFSSASSYRDPTHLHHLSYFSFDYFETGSRSNYIKAGFKVSKRISFGGGFGLIGRFLFWLSPQRWENRYSFVFRASSIKFALEKVV